MPHHNGVVRVGPDLLPLNVDSINWLCRVSGPYQRSAVNFRTQVAGLEARRNEERISHGQEKL